MGNELPLYYRIIKSGKITYAYTTEQIKIITGFKIVDPENYNGGGLENGTLIHPVYPYTRNKINNIHRWKKQL
jgi:hypothetical protein